MKILATVLIVTVALSACEGKSRYGSYENHSTPVRYVVCQKGYINCFLVARFKDIDACERYSETNNWACDTITDPNKPDCRVETTSISVAYCTN